MLYMSNGKNLAFPRLKKLNIYWFLLLSKSNQMYVQWLHNILGGYPKKL